MKLKAREVSVYGKWTIIIDLASFEEMRLCIVFSSSNFFLFLISCDTCHKSLIEIEDDLGGLHIGGFVITKRAKRMMQILHSYAFRKYVQDER